MKPHDPADSSYPDMERSVGHSEPQSQWDNNPLPVWDSSREIKQFLLLEDHRRNCSFFVIAQRLQFI